MIKRWFDDLWGLERSMDESSPLPNLKLQKVGNSGPWLHRLLVLSTISLTIFYQEKIVDIFESFLESFIESSPANKEQILSKPNAIPP